MIQTFDNLANMKKAMASAKIQRDIDSVLKLDLPFFDYQDKVSILYFPLYLEKNPKCLVLISKKNVLVYSGINFSHYDKEQKALLSKANGESTITTFLMIKTIIKNYSEQFQKIRYRMNELDMNPVLEKVEESGRELRRLTDRLEGLVELIIVLKQTEMKHFNTQLVSFDYEVLMTEARYWLERCRSHIYRIASLRTKSEMQSNRELNDTMSRLTVIMTFLTIVSIVVSVPGTVGAIFGIPALSDTYFRSHNVFLLTTLIFATLMSVALGMLYWRSLGLKYKR